MVEIRAGGPGINYNVSMTKRLVLLITISLLIFQPVFSAELKKQGLVKFSGKKDAVVLLEVAVTDEEKQRGLMNRPNLPENRGMVFVFQPAKKITFWMKDTLISLDMIFINRGKIVKIVKNAVPNQTNILYLSDFDVTEVIEVNGGFSDKHMISVGSRVLFKNIPQIDYSIMTK